MLSLKVLHHLKETTKDVLPENQTAYLQSLELAGCNDKVNGSFIEFWSKYSDEFYGKYGLIMDVCQDLNDKESSTTYGMWEEGIPSYYISLIPDTESLFLYNIGNDSVIIIEDGSLLKLNSHSFDNYWPSFNEFLEDFFELK